MFDIAVIFGLTAAVSWGISDFFIAKSAKSVGPITGALAVNSVGVIAYALVYMLFLHQGVVVTGTGLYYALAGSVVFGFGQAIFYRAMLLGPVSLVSPIAGTYPLVSAIVGIVLFAAHITWLQFVSIVLIVLGVAVASGLLDWRTPHNHLGKGPLFAISAALSWGVGLSLLTQSLSVMSWQATFLIELIVTVMVIFSMIFFMKGNEQVTGTSVTAALKKPVVLGAGIIQTIGLLALNLGITEVPKSGAVVIALSSCYPLLTIILALRQLKEHVHAVPLAGALVGIAGVVMLALG